MNNTKKYFERFYDIKPKENHDRNMGIILAILVALTIIAVIR